LTGRLSCSGRDQRLKKRNRWCILVIAPSESTLGKAKITVITCFTASGVEAFEAAR